MVAFVRGHSSIFIVLNKGFYISGWQHAYSPESDSENRHKRHKREHRDGSRRNSGYEELEDGELGEDGEIQ